MNDILNIPLLDTYMKVYNNVKGTGMFDFDDTYQDIEKIIEDLTTCDITPKDISPKPINNEFEISDNDMLI